MTRREKKAPILTLAAPTQLVHRLPSDLLQRAVRVLVVGCGGTGGEIISGLPFLHQAMLAHGHPAGLELLVMDGDVVSPTNIVRQSFSAGDIGHPKALILANRVSAFYGIPCRALTRHLESVAKKGGQRLGVDLVIGCVDTRTARATIAGRIRQDGRVTYWLDLGNDAASGQFVLGQPAKIQSDIAVARKEGWPPPMLVDRLPTIEELYPETVDASADKGDDRPSCSAVEALTRQEPFVNRAIAGLALAMLARLFRYGEITYHGAFVNLETGRTVSLPVSPEHWTRIAPAPVAKTTRKRGTA